jgi:CheY-like chemotaxis protein
VLLAEDDDNDVVLLRAGLENSELGLLLFVARDGQEAVDYLSGGVLPDQPEAPARPDLFLLDITMPRLGGFEVLRWLTARPQFRKMPVVILSYSSLESDRCTARVLGASEFLVKPRTVEGIAEMLKNLCVRYLSMKAGSDPEMTSQLADNSAGAGM